VRVASLLALAVFWFAVPAWGQGGTILHVRSSRPAQDERLEAELSTLGLSVQEAEPDPGATLEAMARTRGARAAVRVAEQDNAIELWVEARTPAAPPIHQIVPVDPRRGWSLAAVASLEILRAELLEVREPQTVPPSPPPPPPPAPEKPERLLAAPPMKAPLLWAHLAGGAESSPGGLGPSVELFGELRLQLRSWFDVGAFGAFSPVAAQVTAAEGIARSRHAILGVAADVGGRFGVATASLGAGGVIALFWLSGDAPAPGYAGQNASVTTAGPLVRACGSLDVTPSLRLRSELAAGVTMPHAVIRFAGRQVADWGQPFVLLTLGLELGFLE
jgi:hypothetical protein